jgi:hypothetical protein
MDLITQVDNLAAYWREVANYLATGGQYDAEDCISFANELQRQSEKRLSALLARKRKQLVELERIVGKTNG